MALRSVSAAFLRHGPDFGVNGARSFVTAAFLRCRAPPPPAGPLPNEDVDVKDLEALRKYRSYTRYLRRAQEAQKDPAWWRTYRSYVEQADPQHGAERVDIGLPYNRPARTKELRERRRVVKENKNNVELERTCRLRTFRIHLDRVQQTWRRSGGPFHIQRLADHYGVFRDLFPAAYFLPQVPLRVCYGRDAAGQAAAAPQVGFGGEGASLWTLLLTCPDEHLRDPEAEYVHWLVGNIPGDSVQAGEQLCHYLPPFPARGTGFHRYVYVLFKQERRIDFQEDARPSPCHSLAARTFKTVDFYRKHQDHLTPAGLAFFQSQWDESVTDTFHNTLNTREPVFEFVRPPVYHPPQVKYPHRQPLRYLDRYREGRPHTYGIY